MEFSRQEYWSRLPFPSPEGLPDPEIESGSLAFPAVTLSSEAPGKPISRRPNRTWTQDPQIKSLMLYQLKYLGSQIFDQTFWVCLWGCFWMILVFESVDKQSRWTSQCRRAPSNPMEAWLEQKCWVRENSFTLCLTVFTLGHWPFVLGFRLRLELTSLPLLDLKSPNAEQNYTISSPGSPSCQQHFLGLL